MFFFFGNVTHANIFQQCPRIRNIDLKMSISYFKKKLNCVFFFSAISVATRQPLTQILPPFILYLSHYLIDQTLTAEQPVR